VRIVDLARQLIELNGLKPGRDIEIRFVGLRPGEKLYEELSYQGENIESTRHPKINRLHAQAEPIARVRGHLEELLRHAFRAEPNDIKRLLEAAVPEYRPCLESEDPECVREERVRRVENCGEQQGLPIGIGYENRVA
jgi:FlaA1/EpsC-like NDP-sugar epimerase